MSDSSGSTWWSRRSWLKGRRAPSSVVVMVFLVLASGAIWWASDAMGPVVKPVNLVHWYHDYDRALKEASVSHKRVLVDFYADWCLACQEMVKDLYSQPRIAGFIDAKFVPLEVDLTNQYNTPALARRFKVQAIPLLVILTAKGKEISQRVGYRGKNPMLLWISEQVGDGDGS